MDTTHDSLNDWIDRLHSLAPEAREAEFASLQEQGWDAGRLAALRAALAERTILGDQISPGSADPSLPRNIGRYAIVDKISEGGMGIVLRAEQTSPIRRTVAIKVLKAGLDSASLLSRFEAEQQALALMEHPNIAKVYDAGMTDTGRAYFVMEYVPGEAITTFCDNQRLTIRQRLELYRDVCAAVQHAHMKGVIHRDLKPSNVLVSMVDGKPAVKVIDFGIAKALHSRLSKETLVTEHGQFLGTPEYMSPEQAGLNPNQIDTRTDVYGLGIMLYELLVGALPFDKVTLYEAGYEAMRLVIAELPPPRLSTRLAASQEFATEIAIARQTSLADLSGELRGEVEWIVLKAMRKERAERYQSSAEFELDLENYLEGKPLLAGPETNAYRLRKFVRRNKRAIVAASSALLIVITAVLAGFYTIRQSENKAISSFVAEQQAKSEAVALASQKSSLADSLAQQASDADFELASTLLRFNKLFEALTYLARSLRVPTNTRAASTSILCFMDRFTYVPILILQHDSAISYIAYSPNGKQIVTVSGEKTVRLWDAMNGKSVGEPMRHFKYVNSVAFTPDSKRLVTAASGDCVRFWDTSTAKQVGEPVLKEEEGVVICLDCQRLVFTNRFMPKATLWDIAGNRALGSIIGPEEFFRVEFSPDGGRVVTASLDHTAQFWDAFTGKALSEPLRHEGSVSSATFSPDGKQVVTTSRNSAQLWNSSSFRSIGKPMVHFGAIRSATFSADSTRVLTSGDDRSAQIWDATTGDRLTQTMSHEGTITCAALSPDGMRVITTSEDRTAKIWDAASGKLLGEPMQHESAVRSAAFSPDGMRVATSSDDKTVKIWPVASGRTDQFLSSRKRFSSAQFSPDGRTVLTTLDNAVQLWDVATLRAKGMPMKHKDFVSFAKFSPDSKRIVTISSDYAARLWDAVVSSPIGEPMQHQDMIFSAEFSADGGQIVTSSYDKTARIWDAFNGKPIGLPMQDFGGITAASFRPDGTQISTASQNCTALLWDAQTCKSLGAPMVHSNFVLCANFSSDGKRLLTAGWDDSHIWDTATCKAVGQPMMHRDRITCAVFSPDGRRAVTASHDKTVRLWDGITGRPIGEPMQHEDAVNSAAFSSDGRRLLTMVGLKSTVQFWDASTGKALYDPIRFQDALHSVALSPDGTRMISLTSRHGTSKIYLRDVALMGPVAPAWLAKFCEFISCSRLTVANQIERIPDSEWQMRRRELLNLASSDNNDPDIRWLRWFMGDPQTRTLSPLSTIMIQDLVERQIAEDTTESLREAVVLNPNHSLALSRLGLHVATEKEEMAREGWRIYADVYTRRAVQLAPLNLEVVLNRKRVVDILRRNPATQAVAN